MGVGFHGAEGLGDMAPFEPDAPCADGHAADAIVEMVMARPAGSVALASRVFTHELTHPGRTAELASAAGEKIGGVS